MQVPELTIIYFNGDTLSIAANEEKDYELVRFSQPINEGQKFGYQTRHMETNNTVLPGLGGWGGGSFIVSPTHVGFPETCPNGIYTGVVYFSDDYSSVRVHYYPSKYKIRKAIFGYIKIDNKTIKIQN